MTPLAIEALEERLVTTGVPEDARAKATLRYLIDMVMGPRIELVGFLRVSATGP